MRNHLARLSAITIAVIGLMTVANADTVWDLTVSNDPNLPCTASAPCSTVTISTSGNDATFTVSSLLSGWVFDKFGFNSSLPLSLVSASGEVGSYSLSGSGNENGWGSFGNNFITGKTGGSSGGDCVVTSGVPGSGCTFSFILQFASNPSISTFEIASSGGSGSGFFAGHTASTGKSGYAGDPVLIPAPELSWTGLLLAICVAEFAGRLRRRLVR
jgi:hypothetical protein